LGPSTVLWTDLARIGSYMGRPPEFLQETILA
jgi:hypothetical protein